MTSRMTRGRTVAVAVLAAAALSLLDAATVGAHAELLEASPADGATVEGTPTEISATFSEPLETDGSTFSIRNAAGERLAVGRIDPDEATRLIVDPVPELPPGTYEMRWQAATADGHIERDTWSFTVAAAVKIPGTPAPAAAPTESATPSPTTIPGVSPAFTATPSGPLTPPDDPVGSTADVFLPIIAGLAIVIIGAGVLLSRRGRRSDGV